MSTFDQLESSQRLSQPVELYTFAIGAEEFFYTSSEDLITVDGIDYEPEPGLQRTSVKQGRDSGKGSIQVRLPATNPFAVKWQLRAPGLPGSVTVVRVQRDESPSIGTTLALEFFGTVRNVGFPDEGLEAVIETASLEAARNRSVPRYGFSAQCNHFLYGPGCNVDPNLHKVSASVTAENGAEITVPGTSAFPTQFIAGYVKPQGVSDFRLIVDQVGDVLTLDLPFKQPVLSTMVDTFKGCDHVIDSDCLNVFGNVIEFGGWPFIPSRNIFSAGLL